MQDHAIALKVRNANSLSMARDRINSGVTEQQARLAAQIHPMYSHPLNSRIGTHSHISGTTQTKDITASRQGKKLAKRSMTMKVPKSQVVSVLTEDKRKTKKETFRLKLQKLNRSQTKQAEIQEEQRLQ